MPRSIPSIALAAPVAMTFALTLLLPSKALALTSVTMEQLRPYFFDETVQRFDAYIWPAYAMAFVENAIQICFWAALLLFTLNASLMERCLCFTESLGRRITSERLQRLGAVLSKVWGDSTWAAAILFVLAYLAIEQLLFLPSSFYFGWVREHQFGFSVQSLPSWLWDWTKGFVFHAISMSALVFGLFGLARRHRKWWLLLGIPCSILMLGAGVLDPLRTKMFRDDEPLPTGPVREAIVATLTKAGVEYEDVRVLKMREISTRVNAFIFGVGPSRRVMLYDTLIAAMTPDEIANVVAHELGHLHDRSLVMNLVGSLLLTPLLWFTAWLLRALGRRQRFGFDDDRDVRALPAIFAFLFALGAVLGPIQAATSRYRENRADDYALDLLQKPEAFRSMMIKLALINAPDLHPPLWMQFQWKTHPLVIDRIGRAEAFAKARGIGLTAPTPEHFALPEDFQKRLTLRAKALQTEVVSTE
jgi:STE24 endopeptidase